MILHVEPSEISLIHFTAKELEAKNHLASNDMQQIQTQDHAALR